MSRNCTLTKDYTFYFHCELNFQPEFKYHKYKYILKYHLFDLSSYRKTPEQQEQTRKFYADKDLEKLRKKQEKERLAEEQKQKN